MSFTRFDINTGYNNQLIKYSKNNGNSFTDITFPAGVWSYENFDEYIKKKPVIKQSGEEDVYPITLSFGDTTFRVTKTSKQDGQDLSKSNFYELIGFDMKIIKERTNFGPRVPSLSQDNDILNILCDLVSDSLVE